MQRKIRRADRVISEHEAKEILEQGEYGILSTVSSDGQPYGVPISYCYKDSSEFVEQGLKYIETAAETTRVYKIIVESITGKSKK